VGRITEVGQKNWRVDVNGKMEALLMLTAITLPGGVQVQYDFALDNWNREDVQLQMNYN
jgi:exosome complex RNA-binding protein Rrp4